jgi:hypothetical protein
MALNTHLSNTTAYAAVVEALVRTGGHNARVLRHLGAGPQHHAQVRPRPAQPAANPRSAVAPGHHGSLHNRRVGVGQSSLRRQAPTETDSDPTVRKTEDEKA